MSRWEEVRDVYPDGYLFGRTEAARVLGFGRKISWLKAFERQELLTPTQRKEGNRTVAAYTKRDLDLLDLTLQFMGEGYSDYEAVGLARKELQGKTDPVWSALRAIGELGSWVIAAVTAIAVLANPGAAGTFGGRIGLVVVAIKAAAHGLMALGRALEDLGKK